MPKKNKTEESSLEKMEEKKGAEAKEKTSEKTAKAEEKKDKEKVEDLKKQIKEKAKKLAEKIEIRDEKKIKEEVEASEKKRKKAARAEKTLFPLDDYVKYSAHLGTKAVTPNMRQFVYRRRADGIAVLNTNQIDEKLKEAVEFLKDFKAGDIFLACKREAGWNATKKFSEVTGIRVFTKKYPAGVITNLQLDNFFETELIIICDPWLDKNALNDATKVKKPVIALCDTNNLTTGVTKIIPCNNKSEKAIGLILYLLAREYLKAQGKETEAKKLKLEDFTGVAEKESSLGKTSEKTAEAEGEVEKVSKGAEEGV